MINFSGIDRYFAELPSTRNNLIYVSMICLSILFAYFVSSVDAQLLDGERRNNTRDGLLSRLGDLDLFNANLSSATDRIVDVVEERIDSRLAEINAKLDEIASAVIPAMIAAMAGVMALAALIIAFIISYWINASRNGRRHKSNMVHLSDHVLQELKANGQLIDELVSSPSSHNSNSDNMSIQPELSNCALKAAISSPYFWDLSSYSQSTMLRLDMTVDRYNRDLRRMAELRDSVILNKIDDETARRVLGGYDTEMAQRRQESMDLSKQLKTLMEANATTKGIGGSVFKAKPKADKLLKR